MQPNGRRYAPAFREAMVRRMVGPDALSACSLAEESGVSAPTLSRWRKRARSLDHMTREERVDPPAPAGARAGAEDRPAAEKLRLLTEAMRLPDEELGSFL